MVKCRRGRATIKETVGRYLPVGIVSGERVIVAASYSVWQSWPLSRVPCCCVGVLNVKVMRACTSHVVCVVWCWNVPRSVRGQWVMGLRGLPADT